MIHGYGNYVVSVWNCLAVFSTCFGVIYTCVYVCGGYFFSFVFYSSKGKLVNSVCGLGVLVSVFAVFL